MKLFLKKYLTTIIKYLLSIILVVYAAIFYKTYQYFLFGMFELLIVFIVSQFFLEKHKILGNIISIFLLLAFNVNYLILIFSNSFLSMIMLSNINQMMTLGSKLLIYIPAMAALCAISFAPVSNIKFKHKKLLLIILIPYILMIIFCNNKYSVYKSYYKVGKDAVDTVIIKNKMKKYANSTRFLTHSDSDNKKYKVKKNTNVIIIFTEGLSRNIIDDERNITPNLKEYMNKSINFDNYYNHTAATFRGIKSQLHSGYQYGNLDKNSTVSMQDILRGNGYDTEFINIEYRNKAWNKYLDKLGFDTIKTITDKPYLTDEEGYNLLYDEAIRLNKEDKPFLLGIYTMETHAGWETKKNKYGDGKNKELNKFHNNDYQFGEFMKKFNDSELLDNTMVIYTTDHATYADWDYSVTFRDYYRDRVFIDKVPFFIYYKGVEPISIDVNGRNSLDFAPTILDIMDIFTDNSFLGDSLLDSNNSSKYDYYFAYPGEYYSTFNSTIKDESKNKDFIESAIEYWGVARK